LDRLPGELAEEPVREFSESEIREYEEFIGKVRGLVIGLSGVLTRDECERVEHYIDHNESGEALHLLAWIIVTGERRVPAEAIRTLLDLADGIVLPEHMPPTLDAHIADL
jgi:hypothetical protein